MRTCQTKTTIEILVNIHYIFYMVRQSIDDVKIEIKKQEKDFYGVDDPMTEPEEEENRIDKALKNTLGEDAVEDTKKEEGFNIADQVNKDELKRRGKVQE
jgi:hypothetical protein